MKKIALVVFLLLIPASSFAADEQRIQISQRDELAIQLFSQAMSRISITANGGSVTDFFKECQSAATEILAEIKRQQTENVTSKK